MAHVGDEYVNKGAYDIEDGSTEGTFSDIYEDPDHHADPDDHDDGYTLPELPATTDKSHNLYARIEINQTNSSGDIDSKNKRIWISMIVLAVLVVLLVVIIIIILAYLLPGIKSDSQEITRLRETIKFLEVEVVRLNNTIINNYSINCTMDSSTDITESWTGSQSHSTITTSTTTTATTESSKCITVKTGCDADWQRYDDRCYRMLTRLHPFTGIEGRRMCRAHGGDLALVKTKQDNDNMMRQIYKVKTETVMWAFIGLSDGVVEGKSQWLDGTDVVYSNWAPDEPNDSHYWSAYGEDCGCVSITQSTYPPGTWNDAPCVTKVIHYLAAFCEKDMATGDETSGQLYGELSSYKLSLTPVAEPSVDDLSQCLHQCSINNLCLSVNFQAGNPPACQLLDATRYERGDVLGADGAWRYLEVTHPRVQQHSNIYAAIYST